MKIIAVDVGTTTIKCALFEDEKIVKEYYSEYSLFSDGKSSKQDSQEWRKIIAQGIKSFGDNSDVSGIAISSQGITILPVDEKGNPLSLAETWLDVSAEKEMQEFLDKFSAEDIYSSTGKVRLPCYTAPKIKRFVDNGVKAHKFLMPLDYVYYLLCGEYYTDYSMASGTMLFDINKREYRKDLLDYCGITKEQLATPVPMSTLIGKVTKQASEEFSLPEGCAVIMGGQDQKMSAYYCGLKPNVACVSIGTSTAICSMESFSGCAVFAFNENDLIYEVAISSTGASMKWLKNTFGFSSYKEMDELAKKAGSSNGVSFDINFVDGASISGLTLGSSKGNVAYALYEGIAKTIKSYLPKSVTELVVYGGGANSEILKKIISGVTNCNIIVPTSVETALSGANKCAITYLSNN